MSTPDQELDALLNDPRYVGKATVVPDEQQEAFARTLRELYVALRTQGFDEDQTIAMLGHTIRGMMAS